MSSCYECFYFIDDGGNPHCLSSNPTDMDAVMDGAIVCGEYRNWGVSPCSDRHYLMKGKWSKCPSCGARLK